MLSIKVLRSSRECHILCRNRMFTQSLDMMLGGCSKIVNGIQSALAKFYGTARRKTFTVAVEGNIGSGKTSLLQHFMSSPSIEVYKEPTDKWRNIRGHNALAKMYEDPSRWALTFQTYVQLTMLQTHMAPQDKPVKLMERSIYSARYCFVENLHLSGKMPDLEYIILDRWFDHLVTYDNCDLDLIVYLQTRPETVHNRIKKRCRKEETHIQLEYLEDLHELHEDWLIRRNSFNVPCPVLVLDANEEIPEMKKVYDTHRKEILCGYS